MYPSYPPAIQFETRRIELEAELERRRLERLASRPAHRSRRPNWLERAKRRERQSAVAPLAGLLADPYIA